MDYKKLSADVDTFGFTVLLFGATEYLPSFAYTVGLWKNFKQPEIISFGLSTEGLQTLLNYAGSFVKEEQAIEPGKIYDNFFENSNSQFIVVDERNIDDYFGFAMEFYDYSTFPALQLVWTDEKNKFPWEPDFNQEMLYRQPLLDRNADFKFREPRNLGVFTTRQWLESGSPILKVIHDNDGDWMFLTGGPLAEEDIKLVSLDAIIGQDPTLNQLFDLDYDEQAERESAGGEWTRTSVEEG